MTGPPDTRPTGPDPDVLVLAGERAAERLGLPDRPSWQVLARHERSRSTTFRLQACGAGDAPVFAYYKVARLHESESRSPKAGERLSGHREALRLHERLAPALASALPGPAIAFSEPLHVDPDRLLLVTLEVPGKPLGKALWYRPPGRQQEALARYTLLGQALRIVEQVGRSEPTPWTEVELRSRAEGHLTRCRDRLPVDEARAVSTHVEALLERSLAAGGAVWAHGDLSPTNILWTRTGIALIDFSWKPTLPSDDVAHFVMRLELERPRDPRWTRQLRDAVLGGYGVGDPPGLDWRLAYLFRAVRALNSRNVRRRRWGARVLRSAL